MEIKNLNEVCMINMGQSPDSSSYNDKKEGLAFYQGNADFGEIHPTTRVWCNNPIKIAEKDDILISVRAPIGSMNIANEKCCIGRGLASIKPIDKNECNQNYLYYFLESKVPYMQSKGTGSTFKAINKGILTSLQIKLPNIREQEKISSIISKIKAQIHNKKLQIRKYDELVKSQFIEMFGDPLSNNIFELQELNTVCDVRDGTHDSPKYHNIGYPLITSKNIINGGISFDDVNLISKEDYDKINQRSFVDNGDILMPMIGTIGNPVIVDKIKDFAIKNVALIKFYKDSKIDNHFLYYLMKSDSFNSYLKEKNKGGTQKFVSLGIIRKIKIITPPIELQNQFAEFVKHIDKLKFTIKQSIEKLELCYKSLMKQYFD